jgi:hypothetical protein
MFIEDRSELRAHNFCTTLMDAEDHTQDGVAILQFLHIMKVCIGQNPSNLIQEFLAVAEVLSDKHRVLLVDPVVVEDQIVEQIHDLFLQTHIEVLVDIAIAEELSEEFEALVILDKPALALEIVSFDPGCKTAESGILELKGLFA